ncbi:protein MULTIPOLAR SPINDLE 1 isoform X1 [Salvia hispanica]|uniref:protein MULTIPOLAR SPINDLE 1 isoform X1 n=1 Tax=Salvia hispanica TaxID=49212 RepID=UPI0020093CD2|nr:protein MULTIPOLAR SPINDLE 1 isoform X1 [Salvia hispanica]
MENSSIELDPSLKLAIAMALAHSRRRQGLLPSATTTSSHHDDSRAKSGDNSEADAIKWKNKAKQRKGEILKLKEDLKIAEEGMQHDLFPQNISCKCYFYDNLGQLSPSHGSYQDRINDVFHRRFLRQVRLAERKKRRHNGLLLQSYISDRAVENELEQLKASVDFLVELCETSSATGAEESNFKNWSHQAADFILAALKDLSLGEKLDETTKSIVSCLIMRLMQMMCKGSQNDESVPYSFRIYIQHLMRKLGSDPYIGQHIVLAVSQRISMAAETLLFMDPFDNAFPKMHSSIYLLIQLIEFLISDYLLSWSIRRDLDSKLLEDWVISVFRAGKALELLENRNAVYILYMDRVTGELTRLLGRDPFPQMLKPDTLGEQRGIAAAAEVEEDGCCKQEEGPRHPPTWWRPWKFLVSR